MITVAVFVVLRSNPLIPANQNILSRQDYYHIRLRTQLAFPQINGRLCFRGMSGRIKDYKEAPEAREYTVSMIADEQFQEASRERIEELQRHGWKLFKIESRTNNRYDPKRSQLLSEQWGLSHVHSTAQESDDE